MLKAAVSTIGKEKVHSAYVAAVELVRSLIAAVGPAADDGDAAAAVLRCRAGEMRSHWSSLCHALARKLGEKRPKAVAEADSLLREMAAAESLVGPAFVAECVCCVCCGLLLLPGLSLSILLLKLPAHRLTRTTLTTPKPDRAGTSGNSHPVLEAARPRPSPSTR